MGRFSDKINEKYYEASDFYAANSDEAWGEVKRLFRHPWRWVLGILAVVLLVGGIAGARFLRSIRAPEIPDPDKAWTQGDPSAQGEIDLDSLDPETLLDPRMEVPQVTGERKENCFTFLLIGTDKASGSTDTMMVVRYDVKNQELNLMSIPRDTMVNVPWDIKKINSVYSVRGLDGLRTQIKKLIGFAPDYYVKIDLSAFVKLVDLIGGVEFEVPRNMDYDDPYQDLHIHLKKGLQTLNGKQAMGLVRWRHNNDNTAGYDDTGRIQTQQAFLKAVAKQCLALKNWTKISGYIEIFNEYVESDLELGQMLWFAQQGMKLDMAKFNTFSMPGNYTASAWSRSVGTWLSYVTVNADEMIALVNERFNPYEKAVTRANLDIMSVNRDGTVSSSTGAVADSKAATAGASAASGGTSAPAQTTTPTQPTQPTPTQPTQPSEPAQPNESGEQPTEPSEPSEPTEPENPDATSEPGEPAEPSEPSEEPGEQPSEPETPPADNPGGGEPGGEEPPAPAENEPAEEPAP